MAEYIAPIQRLVEEFRRLPGVGSKTAARYAFAVLNLTDDEAMRFSDAITAVKRDVHKCSVCFGLTASADKCEICSDENRDSSVICVVENPKDVMVMEKVRGYKGLYHVLGGVISPINGITPDKIRIKELITRVGEGEVGEVIIATNPTTDGEVTAMYISKYLKPLGVKVTRLAYGVPAGSDLEYADVVTLGRAIEGRRDV